MMRAIVILATLISCASCTDLSTNPKPDPQLAPELSSSVTLTANPERIATGHTTTLQWTSENCDVLRVTSGPWEGEKVPTGSEVTVALQESTSFALLCEGAIESVRAELRVEVLPESVAGDLGLYFRSPEGQFRTGDWLHFIAGARQVDSCEVQTPAGKTYPFSPAEVSEGHLVVPADLPGPYSFICWDKGGATYQKASCSPNIVYCGPLPSIVISHRIDFTMPGCPIVVNWIISGDFSGLICKTTGPSGKRGPGGPPLQGAQSWVDDIGFITTSSGTLAVSFPDRTVTGNFPLGITCTNSCGGVSAATEVHPPGKA